MGTFNINLDAGDSPARLQALLADSPRKLYRAQTRVYRKLETYVTREILRACSAATGIPQKRFAAFARNYVRALGPDGVNGLRFWVGTNPIPVHRLGAVTWNRLMTGARVSATTRRRLDYPGSWSWPNARKTKGLVMQRIGTFGRNNNPRLERIDRIDLPIHDDVSASLDAAGPAIMARFLTLLQQEINYAMNHER